MGNNPQKQGWYNVDRHDHSPISSVVQIADHDVPQHTNDRIRSVAVSEQRFV